MPYDADAVWTVLVLDNSAGLAAEQNVTRYCDLKQSTFQPTGQAAPKPSRIRLTFPATTSLNIREDQEVWAGYRNPTTEEWDDSRELYGGYIGVLTGQARGSRHILWLDLDEYSIDFGTTHIWFWPDPANPGTQVPVGLTVADWLTGDPMPGTSLAGLFPARLGSDGGYDLTGIDSALASITFNADARPGIGVNEVPVPGQFGFVTVRQALDNIISCIHFKEPGRSVVAYADVVVDSADPTRLRPRLRLVDLNDTSGSVWATYSTTPGVGEYYIEQPFEHVRDAREMQQRVIVKGAGPASDNYAAAEVYESTRAVNKTRFQTDPGRAVIWVDEHIGTAADATDRATEIEAAGYGALGRLRFVTKKYTPPGKIVEVTIPQEVGTAVRYRVVDSERVAMVGTPKWAITVGTPAPDIGRQFTRNVAYTAAIRQLQALGLKPGATPGSPISAVATHSEQNVGMAADDTTTYRTTKPGFVPPGDTRTTDYVMRERHYDPDDVPREWINDADGTGHPHHWAIPFDAVGTTLFPTPAAYRLQALYVLDETGAVVSNVAVALKVNNSTVSNPTTLAPLVGAAKDVIRLTLTLSSGTFPTGGVAVLLSEDGAL